jgi:DNA-binding LacI/PurR family transcriptional regulator
VTCVTEKPLDGRDDVAYCIDLEGLDRYRRRTPMKPTLQTIADAVGVSRSTVSNAYSRPDQLSPELRAQILEAARRLGYPGPHPAARSLRSGRAGAIGVLFTATLSHAFTDPYAVQFLRGLALSAERHGTGLLLLPLAEHDADAAVHTVSNAMVDGFCVFCVPDWHAALNAIRARGLPVVSSEEQPDSGPDAMFVGIDEWSAAYAAAEHVARLGHRRVAVVSIDLTAECRSGPVSLAGPQDVRSHISRERLRGIRDAFAAAGVDWSELTVVNAANNTREEGAAAAAYVLDRADRCTAILTYSDVLALGVLDALRVRDLRPGRDVSVAGFDDVPEAAVVGLTTIRQPAVQKGIRVGELLLDPPTDLDARRQILPTELVVRSSTGPVERN